MPKIYVIHDTKVEAYHRPVYADSDGQLLRMVNATAQDEKTEFNKYPSDYSIFLIGEYDELSGKIKVYESKISLGTVLDVMIQFNQQKREESYALNNET